MTFKTTKALLEATTLIYGVAILALDRWVAPGVLPIGWVAPAFFYLYEGVFVWLFDRYGKMKPQRVVYTSMIMRGVKFLAAAAMMLVWVQMGLPEKSAFMLYTLGFYLLTSLFEGWSVSAYYKEQKGE